MKTRLTRRGGVVLAAAPASYAFGVASGYPVFRALGGLMAAAALGAVASGFRRLNVSVRRELHPDRVEAGQRAWARLTVHNPTDRRQQPFIAHDPRSDGGRPATLPVRSLPPGTSAEYSYQVPTSVRGRLLVGPFSLERVDPLGLVRTTTTAGEASVLWVHPRRHPVRAVAGSHPRHHHEGLVRTATLRGSLDVRALREYVVGDEPRHLHWKASAQAGRLMVREYVDPEQPRLVVLLDTRAQAMSPQTFESAVEVAASLLYASAEAGHQTRLCTTGGLEVATTGGLAGGRELLDRLCELAQASRLRLDPRRLVRSGAGGGCLVFVTGGSGAGELGAIAAVRRRFAPVLVVELAAAGSPSHPPGVVLVTAPDAALAARRLNLATAT